MKNTIIALSFVFALQTHADLLLGESIGLDFGDAVDDPIETFWNGVDVNQSILDLIQLSDGGTTGVGLVVAGQEFADNAPAVGATINPPFTPDVLTDWGGVFTAPGSWTFTLSDLNDSLLYDVQIAIGRLSNPTVNTTSVSADSQSTGSLGSIALDNKYGSLSGLSTDGFGSIVFTVAGESGDSAFISGAVITAVIPEPSSFSLVGLSLVAILLGIRRKRESF